MTNAKHVSVLLRVVLLLAIAVPTAAIAAPLDTQRAGTVASAAEAPARQATQTNTITLSVVAARTEPRARDGAGVQAGDPVTSYKFLISEDNTGTPLQPQMDGCYPFTDATDATRDPAYPDECDWPSLREVPGWAPVYTQGTEADLSKTVSMTLPAGKKYLISVWGDGYRVDGKHFTLPMDAGADGTALVEVKAHPLPLPPASMTIKVFDDSAMTNGQYDAPVENGLAGFRASINDIAGEITADLFGNPLCTEYQDLDADGWADLDQDGAPIVVKLGAGCYSDDTGTIVIPNLGTIRFDVLVIPPDGETWIQTTTLEGSQGWDTWLQEAGTGMDNEFVVAGEPFPWTMFGFVKPGAAALGGTGSISGQIMAAITSSPVVGGVPYQGNTWAGWAGTKIHRPIEYPWLSLNDLQNGDKAVWVGQGNADGSFTIPNVLAGNYVLTYWDEKQHYILDWMQLTVNDGQVTEVGTRTLTGWFTEFYGTVFHDYNENGKRDPGEPGVPDYLVVLKDRDNTEIDRMSIASLTGPDGNYIFEKAYPMGSWMVLEAYNDRYKTTGITYQAWNQPQETTVLGAAVDVAVLPVLGQPARLDWGVTFYPGNENGGIVGTVFYDTMRAEDDARYAGAEPYQPGIPNLNVQLYLPVDCGTNAGVNCTADGKYEIDASGALAKGMLLMETVTEKFTQPVNCQARDVDGNPIDFPALAPYDPTAVNAKRCLEGPMMGTQIGTWPTGDGGVDFGATLDGNYGFTEGCLATGFDSSTGECLPDGTGVRPLPVPLKPDEYLVEVVIPDDPLRPGKKLFQVTREEDVNMYEGDTFIPAVVPPACAGAMHVVDIAGVGADGPDAVDNPAYAEAGGSRFEGQQKPLCDVKLVPLSNAKSIAPIFTLFTDVPIPGKWKGYIINDLVVSTNPKNLFFGEMAGVPNIPIGVYDFIGRRVTTVYSDWNGVYEVLLPSSATTNAPTPSGLHAGMYYIYGNDPGDPMAPDPLYNPQYRSIGATFESYPGVIVPSDLAPVNNGAWLLAPGQQFHEPARCALPATTPQIFAVSKPYGSHGEWITIEGQGFGASSPRNPLYGVRLGYQRLTIASWSDTSIRARLPINAFRAPAGPYQLSVRTSPSDATVNGLTFHLRGTGYSPKVWEVGVGKTYDPNNYDGASRGPIQHAIDDAIAEPGNDLIVVYPGQKGGFNTFGSYFENLVIYGPVKLQGVGPGGVRTDGTFVDGVHIDGRAIGGDSPYSTWWRSFVAGTLWNDLGGWDGSEVDADSAPRIYEGPVISVFAEDGEFGSGFEASIDGFVIEGGDQQGFPANVDMVTGTPTGAPPNVVVQGGGIFINAYARHLQITNNLIQSNGGAYAGGIRVGTPHLPAPLNDLQNDSINISHNRLVANGGSNLAGAIGLFNGAADYKVTYNDICGNYSVEYGGGISHYGMSPNGEIAHNRILFNRSNDEGGGIMIAGELPVDPTILSPGAGPVKIHANLIQGNISNDDGGGLRFLMSGTATYEVFNNMIANNVSTHEGGGISINDAPNVRVYNNTIMKNITTATSMTSYGLPAPAGLSTSRNSNLLQATLPPASPIFSNPVVFDNVFWDNRAATRTSLGLAGIGLAGDPNPIHYWDMGVSEGIGQLDPGYSLLTVPYGPSDTNLDGLPPAVVEEYDLAIQVWPWRGNPNFLWTEVVAVEAPPGEAGDYHIRGESPARNSGTTTWMNLNAASGDYDSQCRSGAIDMGADEYGIRLPLCP